MRGKASVPSLESVRKAQENIKEIVKTTPLEKSDRLSSRYGAQIFFKREDLQPVRSYKLRGAYNKIKNLYKNNLTSRGVVCASAGNHAQGVALSCHYLKIKGYIYMPVTTPRQKLEQVRMFGEDQVEIILTGDTFDEAKVAAQNFSETNGVPFIHPFDDMQIIEGQATLALEILNQVGKNIDYIFVPVGGGGLISGVIAVFSVLSPETKIIGVEPKGASSMKNSIEVGKNVSLAEIDKFVDGAAVQKVGELTFEICKEYLDICAVVDEGKICEIILELYNKDALVLEPAGALSIAVLDDFKVQIFGKNVVCVLSGSNNDITRMEEIKERAMLYGGLKHYFRVKFPQRPGALKEFVLHVLGEEDDITFFEYAKKNSRETASAIVGIELRDRGEFQGLFQRMKDRGYFEDYLNENPDVLNMFI
ncbi:MAG: threonine ammonia-lyase IlvA [Bergeyella sp.]|nr:threonine ammonia-lyase IlvA [Bergeyella sp.]